MFSLSFAPNGKFDLKKQQQHNPVDWWSQSVRRENLFLFLAILDFKA
jgi:hypothetical protein